jgi:nucleoid-associated protein YgaU
VSDLREERYESVPEFVRETKVSSREKLKSSIISAFKRDRVMSKKAAYNNAANAVYGNGGNGNGLYKNAPPNNGSYNRPSLGDMLLGGSLPNHASQNSSATAATATAVATTPTAATATYEDLEFSGLEDEVQEILHPKSAELETLWPGIGQDFLQVSERGPGFYLTLGFVTGAIMSLAGLWLYAWLTHSSLSYTPNLSSAKKMVVTAGNPAIGSKLKGLHSTQNSVAGNAEVTTLVPVGSNADLVVPAFTTYEVKTGDTLAVIAAKAYHRISPRLLDAICKANGMRSADVLSLGQKINLPEYRPSINQLPAAR